MKTSSPSLENKGANPLDGPMKDNLGVNTEPDMGGSLGAPKPSLKSGYSKGSIHGGEDSLAGVNSRNQFGETGYYNDEY